MNPVKFCQDQIQNGWLIAIFVCSNWQNIWKFCPSWWKSPTPMNICFRYLTHALTTIVPWILLNYVRIKLKMADLSPFLFAQIAKYLKILSVRMNISNTNEYLFPIINTCIYYNHPMDPYNLQQRFSLVGETIALAIYWLFLFVRFTAWQNCLIDWICDCVILASGSRAWH